MSIFSIPLPQRKSILDSLGQVYQNAILQSQADIAPVAAQTKNALQQANTIKAMAMSDPAVLQARINYQNAIANNLPNRNLSPEGRLTTEKARVNAGLTPSGQNYPDLVAPQHQPLTLSADQIQRLRNIFPGGGNQQNNALNNMPSPQSGDQPSNALLDSGDTQQLPSQAQPTGNSAIKAPYSQEQMSNIYDSAVNKKLTTPVAKNTADAAQRLYDEVQSIDITPVAKYAGQKGKINAGIEAAKMASGIGTVDPAYRDYQQFKQFDANLMMDSVRKALNTSVVPEFVKDFIRPLSDPSSNIWNDPEQVQKVWNHYKGWIKNYKDETKFQATHWAANSDTLTGNGGQQQASTQPKVRKYNPTTGTIE